MKPAVNKAILVGGVMSMLFGNAAQCGEVSAGASALKKINHIVVIYQENHSFDNLFGDWEKVDGLDHAHVTQVDQTGKAFACLVQNDVNLTSPPLGSSCTGAAGDVQSDFANRPFRIDSIIAPSDTTCPAAGDGPANGVKKGDGLKGGCTRDIVHRYYQEQYQLDHGKLDRYVTGSDAIGLTMGYYATRELPIYSYLHSPGHPHYVISDQFFQGAFGGSFLNHQWLIAARTPQWTGAISDGSASDLHSVVDANGMPSKYPLYTPVGGIAVQDKALTASCDGPSDRAAFAAGVVCGDFAVNTIQPEAWPYAPGTPAAKRLPAIDYPNIGVLLSEAGIDWAWYSGGWANADGDPMRPGFSNGAGPSCTDPDVFPNSTWPRCPNKLFQFHHQPLNYFKMFAPGTEARHAHLGDEEEFTQLVAGSSTRCALKSVSFIKPLGAENEHPGYASQSIGNDHLVKLIQSVVNSACARDTMIIVTYDEFGGQADHVAPPSKRQPKGPFDQWGPGTRIPTLVVASALPKEFGVDHLVHDTTSILATIEHRFGLGSLGSRDAATADLGSVFGAK
jgi:acid phosphatase